MKKHTKKFYSEFIHMILNVLGLLALGYFLGVIQGKVEGIIEYEKKDCMLRHASTPKSMIPGECIKYFFTK